MSKNELDIDIIDSFLNDELDEHALASFNKRLSEDNEFSALLEEIKVIRGAVMINSRGELLKRLEVHELAANEHEVPAPVIPLTEKNRSASIYRIAAGIAVLSVLGYLIYWLGGQNNSDDLFNRYYFAYTDLKVPASRGETTTEQLALSSYEKEDFSRVIEILEDEDSENINSIFLRGLAYLGQNSFIMAIPLLEIVSNTNGSLADPGKFYLALAYIGIHDYNSAYRSLSTIEIADNFPVEELKAELQNKLSNE